LSFEQLKDLSDRLTQLLPSVKDSVAALNQDLNSKFENASQAAESLERRYRSDLEDLKARIEQLGDVKNSSMEKRTAKKQLELGSLT
jgi:ElaB/YqjD/DUF883 family membrane-anchored ribosome-binding protein